MVGGSEYDGSRVYPDPGMIRLRTLPRALNFL